MGEKTIGGGWGDHSTWSSPPLFMVDYYCESKVKGKWGKPQKQVENQTPEHVHCCHVSACVWRVLVPFPPGTKSTWGLVKYVEFSPSTPPFLTLRFYEKDLAPTPNLLRISGRYSLRSGIFDTPSAWAYLVSPLKVIWVTWSVGWSCKPTVGSHCRCHGQLLL